MLAGGMVKEEEKRQGYLDTLRLEAGRLNHLIENVLSYSRIERGSARTKHETLALESLLGRFRSRLGDRVAQEGGALVVDCSPSSQGVELETDVTAVEQIVFNLVDNACKYGMGEEEKGAISMRAESSGGVARISICDEGCGIDRKDLKKLFRPFHKSAKEAAHSKPGVGLGLALSRRLARALGGDLKVEKGERAGACFVLELPVKR
jgi:signal transduction histidine kinase